MVRAEQYFIRISSKRGSYSGYYGKMPMEI
jgi:hypothetical protein